MDNQRNLIIAVVMSLVLLLGFDVIMGRFYPEANTPPVTAAASSASGAAAPGVGGDAIVAGAAQPIDLDSALKQPGRVAIDSAEVAGSINPVGARIDDILLKTHRQTVDEDSGPVRLFAPEGTPGQQFAQFGWIGQGVKVPDAATVWQVEGNKLTAETPVTLRWNNGEGLTFTQQFSIDDFYMVSVKQTVANTSGNPIALQPYALINRTSRNASPSTFNLHSGPLGLFNDGVDFGTDYNDLDDDGALTPAGKTGWLGFTDIYWMGALIPDSGAKAAGSFRPLGNALYRADLIYDAVTVPAGKAVSRTTQLFAGAKESEVLNQYQANGIEKFGLAIDWGWFRWFMVPIFWMLREIYAVTGNFGVAIILLTCVIRGLMFPIAQKQFASMAAMRAVQPKMKALQERFKDNKQQLQQEMAKLYKEEKINPLAGCLPILLQIPIFFALYKVLLIAIEMRHKPFALWIEDLSAPDPATILNGFGLLPYDVPGFLGIGVLAVLLGITMWLQFKLNPAAMDPMQQQIFMIMPWVLMFVMAPFAAGLLLYWITSNILTIAQQKYLYSKHPQLKEAADKEKAEKARAVKDAK